MNDLGLKSGNRFLPVLTASVSSAVLLAVAMPGRFGWWPLLFFALVPLLWCNVAARPGRSFFAGFITGFLYHVFLLYWIVIVLGRYGGLQSWLAIVVMFLLAAYMGIYMGVFSWLLTLVLGQERRRENFYARMMIFAPFLWVGLDWLRGRLFTGFPWMDLGYGLYEQPLLIQAADLGGHHLITFILVLVNTCIFYLVKRYGQGTGLTERLTLRIIVGTIFLLVLLSVYSFGRYQQLEKTIKEAEQVNVAVVQGNIPQNEKWTPDGKKATLDIYRQLSRQAIAERHPELVVWPETALPFYPGNDPLFFSVTDFAEKEKIWLLTGSPYFTVSEETADSGPALHYYNSALLISPDGRLTDRYSKQHLVPFGEYVPLSRYLSFLDPVVVHVGDFTPGVASDPLHFGRIKAGVLICFESIFSGLARKQVAHGANVLVNLTNDAWYGRSSAPHQSFAMSVFRSVETRRSLIRAANTGISSFVDPLGRVLEKSSLFEPLVLTAEVPLCEEQSFFTRCGFFFAPACLILLPFLFILLRRDRWFIEKGKIS
jgi:apolipoprotein N-acyltransferase